MTNPINHIKVSISSMTSHKQALVVGRWPMSAVTLSPVSNTNPYKLRIACFRNSCSTSMFSRTKKKFSSTHPASHVTFVVHE